MLSPYPSPLACRERLHGVKGSDFVATKRPAPTRKARPAPERETFTVNIDFPRDLLQRIDAEADRIGVARQAWIRLRLSDLLDATTAAKAATR